MEMRTIIESYWHQVTKKTGATFNYDFWQKNTPQRSTYPACRAIIAADWQNKEEEMITAIQHAYYLYAKNPSLMNVLERCAEQIDLDMQQFKEAIISPNLQKEFEQQLQFARSIGGHSFPSLFLQTNEKVYPLPLHYTNKDVLLTAITKIIK